MGRQSRRIDEAWIRNKLGPASHRAVRVSMPQASGTQCLVNLQVQGCRLDSLLIDEAGGNRG